MDGWKFQREIDGWASWGQVFQDLEGFSPFALSILASHGFPPEPLQPLTPGTNGVFRSGERVIKLFAPIESGLDTLPDWQIEKLLLEKAAELRVQAPRLLAAGSCQDRYLFRYLILSYCHGREAGAVLSTMTDEQKEAFAVRLRGLLDRLHQPLDAPVFRRDLVGQVMENPRLKLVAPRLAEEIRRRAAAVPLTPLVLVHGDCTGENLLVEEDGSLTLIDFADSSLAPACYELPAVVLGLFGGDPVLVRAFRGSLPLEAFLDQLMDGLCLHDFAGNIVSEFLAAHHIPVEDVESLDTLRDIFRQKLA